MSNFAASVSTDPKDEATGDAALLHLLDGYYIKRHTVNPWNTSGGYCDVFTGDHPRFGKIALKRPRGNQCDESNLRNFRREARIWKELRHPNILQFVGMIDTPSHIWLVSVFAENGRLHEYLSTHREADRRNLVLQFTTGLAYLHSKDVVHGDLKADNLLISADHYLLIADFGLSKMKGMSTYTSKKGVGSVRWMAPELLEGEDEEEAIKTSSSDVYAYGITLSEILRAELPFKQYSSMIALVKAVLKNKRPPIPEESALGSPYAILWTTAKDCWNAKPSNRPTMVDICHRFSLDCTKPVDSAVPGISTSANEAIRGYSFTEPASSRPEKAVIIEGVDFNPQSVNPTTRLSDDRLLHLLGNAEHGDIGHMSDDGLCFEGTRIEILDRLDAWADKQQSSPRIMLLKGQAGRGKSTIARSIASRYQERWGDEASSAIFHFRRGNEALNKRPLLALARQLGSSADQRVRTVIFESLQNQEDVTQLRLEEQFKILFARPFNELGLNPPRILLVIDAVDECSDHSLISAFLRVIRKHAPPLPPTIKFLLTTRPEEHIVGPFKTFPDSEQEDLDDVDLALIDRDVRSYFSSRLSEIQKEFGLDADWVPPIAINELVSLSQGLFQWAHAAMEYVRERPILNLRRLVRSPTNLLGLPALYKQIISTAFPLQEDIKEESNFLALIQHVIGSLVVAHRPMSPAILEYLWDNVQGGPPVSYPSIEIRDGILGRLGSILVLPDTPEGPIHFMHASVRDFFTDPARCEDKRFLVDTSVHHTQLAIKCFDRMRNDLKQSILSINDASGLASGTINIVEQRLLPGLQYCCRSWSTHLSEASNDGHGSFDNVQTQMQEFCTERLPYWIEGLSLIGVLSEAFDMIRRAIRWLKDSKAPLSPTGIPATVLLSDTNDFCRQFFKHMSTYPRHVTLSYLLQFRSETVLRTVYASSVRRQAPWIVRGPALKRFDWSGVIRGGSAILCVAFSPDGKALAFGLSDNTIRLWNMDTGEPIELPLVGHEGRVTSLAFSPNGKTLVSGSDDKTVRLWNMDTGEPKGAPLAGHKDRVTSVAYSPNGTILASGSFDATLRLWNMNSEEPTEIWLSSHTSWVTNVVYSPDGKSLASRSFDGKVHLWTLNSETGKPMKGRLISHPVLITSVAFSPDGKTLAFGLYDSTIQLQNITAEEPVKLLLLGHRRRVRCLAFSPDGKTLASGSSDTMIRLWNVDTGEPRRAPFIGHKYEVANIAYSPDGKIDTGPGESTGLQLVGHNNRIDSISYSLKDKTLASGSADNQIRLWDISTGQQRGLLSLDHEATVTSIALSSNKVLATGSDDHQIRVWNIDTGALMETSPVVQKAHVRVSGVDYSPDGKTLKVLLDNGTICLWTTTTGQGRRAPWPFGGHATAVAYTPDGKTLASGSTDSQIRLWDIDTGKQKGVPFIGHNFRVTSIAFSSSGKTFASASNGNQIRLWDTDTGESLAALFIGYDWLPNMVQSLAFSPNGETLASGLDDGTIQLWKISTASPYSKRHTSRKAIGTDGKLRAFESDEETLGLWSMTLQGQPFGEDESRVTSLAFSPDGETLASGLGDSRILLWDVSAGKSRGTPFTGHQTHVSCLAFSSDGRIIASGSIDGIIHLWTAATGQHSGLSLCGPQGYVNRIAFSVDGKTLISHSALENFNFEVIHWKLSHHHMRMDTKADLREPDAVLEKPDVDLKDGPPHDVPDIRLDLASSEAYGEGWVFVRDKRCFWLPPEFYLDRNNRKVDMSLFGDRFLVLHHPNIHILDISAFL